MAILHVCPNNDTQEHIIDKDETCWCKPRVNDEGQDAKGFKAQTVIHNPVKPMVQGHDLDIRRVWMDANTGEIYDISTPVKGSDARQSLAGQRRIAMRLGRH